MRDITYNECATIGAGMSYDPGVATLLTELVVSAVIGGTLIYNETHGGDAVKLSLDLIGRKIGSVVAVTLGPVAGTYYALDYYTNKDKAS